MFALTNTFIKRRGKFDMFSVCRIIMMVGVAGKTNLKTNDVWHDFKGHWYQISKIKGRILTK